MNNRIELELGDGTVASWFVNDEIADQIAAMIEAKIGKPDSIKL